MGLGRRGWSRLPALRLRAWGEGRKLRVLLKLREVEGLSERPAGVGVFGEGSPSSWLLTRILRFWFWVRTTELMSL